MREEHIKIDVPVLKVPKQEQRKYNQNLPNPHYFLGLISGSRGSGKTTAFVQLMGMYDKDKVFDEVFLFCPTIKNDPKYALLDDMNFTLHKYEDYNNQLMSEVIGYVNTKLDDYKKYLKKKKLWDAYSRGKPVESFTMSELMDLKDMDFQAPPNHFPKGKPNFLMVFDDLQYNKELYSNTSTAKDDAKRFFIRHRHHACNVLFLTQSFINGVPKQIRSNLNMMMLFANKSPQMKKTIADELSSHISKDEFIALWDYATKEPHSFLKIEYEAKPNRKFSKNFDTFLTLN